MVRRLPIFLSLMVFLVAACGDGSVVAGSGDGDGDDEPQALLDDARSQWSEADLTSYRLTIRELCFCPETVWIDDVADGEIIGHEAGSDESLFDPGARTMDDLFDEVQAAIDGGFATLDLDFDPETGALRRYWVDVNVQMADEEHGVEVELRSS